MDKHFTHLHVHTDFSLLDGAITLDKLIDFGKQQNLKALAITDHGNIFGAVKFFDAAKKAGIKPILGIEAYITEDINVKKVDNRYYHIILIVKNDIGYKNLCKLIHYSYKKGFYFKPRIDYKLLEKYSEGLIATSACLGGHIPQLLIQKKYEQADKLIKWFLNIFGKDNFYLEVQPEDQDQQRIINQELFNISKSKDINLLATGDCHYVDKADHEAHEVMLSMQTRNKLSDAKRFTFGECRAYMRTEQQMLEIFKDHPEAVYNAGKIADRCNFDFKTGELFLPKFDIPENYTKESYFTELCQKGLKDLINNGRVENNKEVIDTYNARLKEEISLITKMGYIGYFLIVSDLIQWARNNKVPVGPGRGSAAGSLVAWALQITDIDPIKYNLLFERFLNPERVTMPDIDTDFCIEGRDKVVNYVKDKYGHDKVCQIITFGTMLAKGVIKDVARVLGIPFEDANKITNLIPEQLKITLHEALKQEPKLQELIDTNSDIAKLFNIALKLEGTTRHASKHAAGIVISPEAISDVLPVYIPTKTDDLVTQYGMTELEKLGFLKMDFLGLKNLTIIDLVIKLIKKNHNIDLDIIKLPLDDAKTFKLLAKGHTSGVFQLESSGLKEVLKNLQPEVFEDIIAVNALYRPGPLGSGMVDDFIKRRHGEQKISYLFDELEPILKETYGVIVYQEQVMKIASTIAGYSLGEADILRRAMGKKKFEVMEEQRKKFIKGAVAKNFDKNKSGKLFDLMAYFAGYGFNKSHSAAYALIAYQTAYLKANYTVEFMACLISQETNNTEKMAFYLNEARDIGLNILPPDIHKSDITFSTNDNNIRFGLQGIKNVGITALENIITERNKSGEFKDILDFCVRVDLRSINKRVIESLINSGALDCLNGTREQKCNELSRIINIALSKKKAIQTGQRGLFDNFHSTNNNLKLDDNLYRFQADISVSDKIRLEKEKEVTGLYLSAQPLDTYKKEIKWLDIKPIRSLNNINDNLKQSNTKDFTICCGNIIQQKVIKTKKGQDMAFLEIEDYTGKAEIVIFPKLYTVIEPWLKQYQVFIVKGMQDITNSKSSNMKIKAQAFIPIDLIFEHWAIKNIDICLPNDIKENILEDTLKNIKSFIVSGSTSCALYFKDNNKKLKLKPSGKIKITRDLLITLEKHNIDFKVYNL